MRTEVSTSATSPFAGAHVVPAHIPRTCRRHARCSVGPHERHQTLDSRRPRAGSSRLLRHAAAARLFSEDAVTVCPGASTVQGIDVSEFQGNDQLAGGESGGPAVRFHPRLRRHLSRSEVRHQLGGRQSRRRLARRLSILPRVGRSDHHRRSIPRAHGHARRRRPAADARRRGHRRTIGDDDSHAHGAMARPRRAEDRAHPVHLRVAGILAEPRQPERVALSSVGRQLAGHLSRTRRPAGRRGRCGRRRTTAASRASRAPSISTSSTARWRSCRASPAAPPWSADYVSQSWPLASTPMQMIAGQTVAASITLKNTGEQDVGHATPSSARRSRTIAPARSPTARGCRRAAPRT